MYSKILERKQNMQKKALVRKKVVQWVLRLYKRDKPKIEAKKVKRNIALYFAKTYRDMKA